MVILRAAITALGAAAILLSNPALHAQAFSFGPVQSVNLPAPALFANLSAMDMNGDGKTDICLSMWDVDSPFKYIYVGDGAGNFAATPITVHESPDTYAYGTVQFFDVNGDGYADEVYSYGGFTEFDGVSYISHPGVFAVLLGDGKGNFTQTTSIPQEINSGNGPYILANSILAAGSFRNNGKLDFTTVFADPSNPGHGVLTVYLNDGDGIFHAGSTIEVTGGYPLNPVIGDFNGDGHLDIAWLDNEPEPGTNNDFAIHCLDGNGDGTFSPDKICYTIDGRPDGILAADLNGDHKADLVVFTGPKVGAEGAQARLVTLLAKQTGGFYWLSSVSLSLDVGLATSLYGMPPLTMADLNGDGYQDVIFNGQFLFAGSATGVFGKTEWIGFPGIDNPAYFAPLKKGGLPAMFYSASDDGDSSTKLSWQLNTSPK